MKNVRVNEDIRTNRVFLIENGNMSSQIPFHDAFMKAKSSNMDLVEVSQKDGLPICKIMDYGKFKYEQSKKDKKNRKPKLQVKEIKFRPNTNDNDLLYRAKHAKEFLAEGHKVKLVVRFRGRELEHMLDTGKAMLERFIGMVDVNFHFDSNAKVEGKDISITLSPGNTEK